MESTTRLYYRGDIYVDTGKDPVYILDIVQRSLGGARADDLGHASTDFLELWLDANEDYDAEMRVASIGVWDSDAYPYVITTYPHIKLSDIDPYLREVEQLFAGLAAGGFNLSASLANSHFLNDGVHFCKPMSP